MGIFLNQANSVPFWNNFTKGKPPALRHLKVSISADMRKHFNTFNNRIPTMLKVLITLAVPNILLTFHP